MTFSQVSFGVLSPHFAFLSNRPYMIVSFTMAVYNNFRFCGFQPHVFPPKNLQTIIDVVTFLVIYSTCFPYVNLLSRYRARYFTSCSYFSSTPSNMVGFLRVIFLFVMNITNDVLDLFIINPPKLHRCCVWYRPHCISSHTVVSNVLLLIMMRTQYICA